MKRIYVILIGLFSLLFAPGFVNAASANISVSASDTVMVGNNVTVTVKYSSSNAMGSWEGTISYDKSVLQFVSSNTEGAGLGIAGVSAGGTKSKSYTFTFKAIKKGSGKVSVGSYVVYDYDSMGQMSVNAGSKTINVKTKEEIEASYSSNANLKSITVGEYSLDPAFDKNTKEYTVEVPNEIETVNITATKEDSTASVAGAGDKELIEGNNKFEIVVTAQKGNTNTYVVNVYRKELNPITVTVDGKDLGIVRKADGLLEYTGFTPTTTTYEDTEIPALESEIIGYTLIGLKDDDGNVTMYIYKDGKIGDKYYEIASTTAKLYPLPLEEKNDFKDYVKTEIVIDGVKVNGYAIDDDSKYIIIYAQDVTTGDIKYYTYCVDDGSIQTYNKELLEFYNKRINNYKYSLIGCFVFIVLLLFIMVLRKPSKKNNKKSQDEILSDIENVIDDEIKEEIKNDEVVEEIKENEKNEEDDDVKVIELQNTRKLSKKELKRIRKEEKERLKNL